MERLLNKIGLDSASLGFILYGFGLVYLFVAAGIFGWHLLIVPETQQELLWAIPGVILAVLGMIFLRRGGYWFRAIPWPWRSRNTQYEGPSSCCECCEHDYDFEDDESEEENK